MITKSLFNSNVVYRFVLWQIIFPQPDSLSYRFWSSRNSSATTDSSVKWAVTLKDELIAQAMVKSQEGVIILKWLAVSPTWHATA